MLSKKNASPITLITVVISFFAFDCSSGGSSSTEARDSIKEDVLHDDTISFLKEPNDNLTEEPLNLQMNDFEQLMIDAFEEGWYLVQTKHGFDYIKVDINNDSIDDAVALFTLEENPDDYDFETVVIILVFQALDDEILKQSGGRSQNLGGGSIRYKDYKKLAWEDGTLIYTHMAMINEINVDIKIRDSYSGATAMVNKVSICDYDNTPPCEYLFIASEKDTVNLIDLNVEFMDSLRSK